MKESDMTILRCWTCAGDGGRPNSTGKCTSCHGAGKIFWVEGRSFPYTPEGEKAAQRVTPT